MATVPACRNYSVCVQLFATPHSVASQCLLHSCDGSDRRYLGSRCLPFATAIKDDVKGTREEIDFKNYHNRLSRRRGEIAEDDKIDCAVE